MAVSAREAAKRIGCAYSTVTLHCRKMGIQRSGRDYVLEESQVAKLAEEIQDRRGPPAKRSKA